MCLKLSKICHHLKFTYYQPLKLVSIWPILLSNVKLPHMCAARGKSFWPWWFTPLSTCSVNFMILTFIFVKPRSQEIPVKSPYLNYSTCSTGNFKLIRSAWNRDAHVKRATSSTLAVKLVPFFFYRSDSHETEVWYQWNHGGFDLRNFELRESKFLGTFNPFWCKILNFLIIFTRLTSLT